MKNYQITDTSGKTHWIDRSIAVAGFVFKREGMEYFVLANQRGGGVSNHNGLWNCPCGYLDFDETLKEACAREIKEECRLIIEPSKLKFYEVEDSPSAFRQNVTHRFTATVYDGSEQIGIGTEGEDDEVADVKWISVNELDKYEWAFNHDKVITDIVNKVYAPVLKTLNLMEEDR